MTSKIRQIQKRVSEGQRVKSIVLEVLNEIDAKDGVTPVLCRSDDEIKQADQIEWEELLTSMKLVGMSNAQVETIYEIRQTMLRGLGNPMRAIFESLGGMPPTIAIIIAISTLDEEEIDLKDAADFIIEAQKRLEGLDVPEKELLKKAVSARPVHAYLQKINRDEILDTAEQLDQQIINGNKLPLAGVTLAIKDVFAFGRTTAASKILDKYIAPKDYVATPVKRLIDSGAIVIGKTNLDEFALGASNESTAYWPAPRNPHNTARTPGGSSGGSAVAVSSGLATAALGSDTAGSIRLPASYCGVVGVKPTYGLVSRYGLLALASSLDCVGPITTSVEDAAILLGYMVYPGPDGHDQTIRWPSFLRNAKSPEDIYASTLGEDGDWEKLIRFKKIGIPIQYFLDFDLDDEDQIDEIIREPFDIRKLSMLRGDLRLSGLMLSEFINWIEHTSSGVKTLTLDLITEYWSNFEKTAEYASILQKSSRDKLRHCPTYWDRFQELTDFLSETYQVQFSFVSLPHTWLSIPVYFIVSRQELASNLHRYDGLKYGVRPDSTFHGYDSAAAINRMYNFGRQPKQRILMGINTVQEKNREALLYRAQRARRLIREDFEKVFETVDFLLTPTVNTTAPHFGGFVDTVTQQQMDEFTVPANHAGVPAISLPFYLEKDKLFQSVQIIAPDFKEESMFQLARAIEAWREEGR